MEVFGWTEGVEGRGAEMQKRHWHSALRQSVETSWTYLDLKPLSWLPLFSFFPDFLCFPFPGFIYFLFLTFFASFSFFIYCLLPDFLCFPCFTGPGFFVFHYWLFHDIICVDFKYASFVLFSWLPLIWSLGSRKMHWDQTLETHLLDFIHGFLQTKDWFARAKKKMCQCKNLLKFFCDFLFGSKLGCGRQRNTCNTCLCGEAILRLFSSFVTKKWPHENCCRSSSGSMMYLSWL